MNKSLKPGDKVTFDTDKVQTFIAETSMDNPEIKQYQKIILAGVNQVGIVKTAGTPLTTVSYPDGWDVPVPTKYLILLPVHS